MEESKDDSNVGQQQQAIYSENSYYKALAIKAFIAITVFMVLLSILFCIIVGAKDNRGELWLLITNLSISSFVTLTLCYWYKKGELASDKAWFLILVASILIFQTITTDVYVFNPLEEEQKPTQVPINPTVSMMTTKNSTNINTLTSKLLHNSAM